MIKPTRKFRASYRLLQYITQLEHSTRLLFPYKEWRFIAFLYWFHFLNLQDMAFFVFTIHIIVLIINIKYPVWLNILLTDGWIITTHSLPCWTLVTVFLMALVTYSPSHTLTVIQLQYQGWLVWYLFNKLPPNQFLLVQQF